VVVILLVSGLHSKDVAESAGGASMGKTASPVGCSESSSNVGWALRSTVVGSDPGASSAVSVGGLLVSRKSSTVVVVPNSAARDPGSGPTISPRR